MRETASAGPRLLRPAAAVAALALAVLALGQHVSRRAPEDWPARGWLLGPPADALARAAGAEVERARAILADESLPLRERLAGYRGRLAGAERLLLRALRADPAQPEALAELCVVRWELDPPLDEQALRPHLERIELASRIAPGVAAVQRQLGELLLAMGRSEEAFGYLRRALELEPALAPEVVERVRAYVPSALRALEALPASPEVLLALEDWLVEDGRPLELLAALERLGLADEPRLLIAYGRVCLAANLAERLVERMTTIETDGGAAEAERLIQRSTGRRRLGDLDGALEDARAARAVLPGSDRVAEHLGRTALHAGRGEEAVAAFHEALRLAAAAAAARPRRAVLYRLVGQAEEAAGRPHLAYDAYRQALRLAPDDPVAGRRVAEMEAAPR